MKKYWFLVLSSISISSYGMEVSKLSPKELDTTKNPLLKN